MTLENKKELVRLLHLYMADIMRQDAVKRREDKRNMGMHIGIKSQFDHARIIVDKLTKEISTDLFRS